MFKQIFILILIFLFFMFAYVKYLERKGIYYPLKEIDFTPSDAGLKYEDVNFVASDGVNLNGWFISQDNPGGTLLFLHGNAGNIGHRLEKLSLLHRMQVNIFIIDYRGYGRSEGRPSENGIYLDAEAAYDYLINKRNIKPQDIILYGESLGNAAVIHLAAEKEVAGLIVEGTFSRGKDMARRVYPFLPAFFFSDSFNSLEKIKKINAPKLFIHSRNDEIVPIALARKLYSAAGEPKQFTELSGGHNTAFFDSQEKYVSSIKSFIEQLK